MDKKTIAERYSKKPKKDIGDLEESINNIASKIKNNSSKDRLTLDTSRQNCQKVQTKLSKPIAKNNLYKCNNINERIIKDSALAHGLVKTPDDFIRYFSLCCEEDFNFIPEWDSKNRKNLKTCIFKSLNSYKISDVTDFINFTVSEWHFLTEHYFNWMEGSAPPRPSPSFIVKFRDRFCEAYLARSDFNETLSKNISEYSVDEFKGLGLKTGIAEKLFDLVQGVESGDPELNKEREKKYKAKVKKLKKEITDLESENRRISNTLNKLNKEKDEIGYKFREYLNYEHKINLTDDQFLDMKADLMTDEDMRLEAYKAEQKRDDD